MKVLGCDPGFERLGVSVVEKTGSRDTLLYSTCLRTSKTLPFAQRLAHLGEAVEALIAQWKPDVVALENLYFEKNAKTAMDVAAVRGMLLYIASHNGLTAFEYTPLQVKVAMTGYGKSDKAAVATMVFKLLGIRALPGGRRGLDDELDAIAIGLTCLAYER
jgi:crossover junction endodeoxyribonuclease RuvC